MGGLSQPRPWFATALLWIGTACLFILFLAGGIQKLTQETSALRDFARWQYPVWFMLVIGAVELSGACLILIPRLAFVGAALITLDMVGGVITTLRVAEDERALLSAFLLAVAVLICIARWPQFWGRALLKTRRSLPQGSQGNASA